MHNQQDITNIKEQLAVIKDNNLSSLESIESINLIMVDDNNGRVKDARLSAHMAKLRDKFHEMTTAITQTEEMLKDI